MMTPSQITNKFSGIPLEDVELAAMIIETVGLPYDLPTAAKNLIDAQNAFDYALDSYGIERG